ncbi:MAG TPA: hypothetical protein VFY16_02415 [Gemmatimonadaceae bacterium]|nr:hypothetical protein [Gemmatimonadaceae bacterium]
MSRARRVASGLTAGVALAGLSYLAYAAITYGRYGRGARPTGGVRALRLGTFIPAPEVVERHEIRVAAPAEITLTAAREIDLYRSPVIRAIFRARELVMRAHDEGSRRPRAFVDEVLALGWGILADVLGREMIFGAVTQPWEGDVEFRPIPPDQFADFAEPGYAKIVWTLAADPLGPHASMFRTETRVATTDPVSRERFRRYWALTSPGIVLIRRATLPLVKADAERRARGDRSARPAIH